VTAVLVPREHAGRLPLTAETVELVVTSPPDWQLRAHAAGHAAGAQARTNHHQQGRLDSLDGLAEVLGKVGG
jgi:hypothetical protein